jgi:hypothetical protein
VDIWAEKLDRILYSTSLYPDAISTHVAGTVAIRDVGAHLWSGEGVFSGDRPQHYPMSTIILSGRAKNQTVSVRAGRCLSKLHRRWALRPGEVLSRCICFLNVIPKCAALILFTLQRRHVAILTLRFAGFLGLGLPDEVANMGTRFASEHLMPSAGEFEGGLPSFQELAMTLAGRRTVSRCLERQTKTPPKTQSTIRQSLLKATPARCF